MVYVYDGSEDGFFTAFLQAFTDPNAHIASGETQLFLGEETTCVCTDVARAQRAKRRLLSFDKESIGEIRLLLRCGKADAKQVAFAYLRKLANEKKPVRNMLTCDEVFRAVEYLKKIKLEIHHLHGFIRFMEMESGALYAPFSPDNDICDLLLPHFRARFPLQPFVLHDVKRKKAAFYDGKRSCVLPLDKTEILLSAQEEDWQALWKQYYDAVNIPSRARVKQMISYMPRRYWTFMPERQDGFLAKEDTDL